MIKNVQSITCDSIQLLHTRAFENTKKNFGTLHSLHPNGHARTHKLFQETGDRLKN